MLRTKQAKKLLTKKEQKHLTESSINSQAAMLRQVEFMEGRKDHKDFVCWDCKSIARKLGLM